MFPITLQSWSACDVEAMAMEYDTVLDFTMEAAYVTVPSVLHSSPLLALQLNVP